MVGKIGVIRAVQEISDKLDEDCPGERDVEWEPQKLGAFEDVYLLKGAGWTTYFFLFRDGISCFWRSVNSTKNIFLMFAIWLFGKIIVDDFWVSPATSQAKG